MIRAAVLLATIAGLFAAGGAALAHTRDQVFSSWVTDGERITATIRLPARLTVPPGSETVPEGGRVGTPALHFIRSMSVSLDAAACTAAQTAPARTTPDGTVTFGLSWTCEAQSGRPGRLTIRVDALFDRYPNHVHFARLRLPDGEPDEYVFTYSRRQHTVELRPENASKRRSPLSLTADYMGLGITHILGGADHLAFVLGLMLLAAGLRTLLFVITGFTLGHSLTLALAATGVATPVDGVIEALIGFTVATVAAEAAGRSAGGGLSPVAATVPLAGLAAAAMLFGSALPVVTWAGLILFAAAYAALTRRGHSARWAVALAATFGLVHGFGFAGVLQESGLPEDRLIPALLGFNLGVEIGQLIVVALALGIAVLMARRMPATMRLWGTQALASALCGLGTFWFVSRAFAG